MSEIADAADRFRRSLLNNERAAANRIVQRYGTAWSSIKGELDALSARIKAAQDVGETIGPSWLFQQQRLSLIKGQMEAALIQASRYAAQEVVAGQRAAVSAAQMDAAALASMTVRGPDVAIQGSFTHLNVDALNHLIGSLSADSPLARIFASLEGDFGKQAEAILIQGMALGWNPTKTARQMREAFSGNAARALTIARTETLRSYREASRLTYAANPDVVHGWVWRAARGLRTCPACIALDGTVHALDEQMQGHPQCRCAMLPLTDDLQAEGIETGEQWFNGLGDTAQEGILGPSKYQLFRDGTAILQEFAHFEADRQYGGMWRESTLGEIGAGDVGIGDLEYLGGASPDSTT